jgi:RNA polymerase sigma-70 factor, ECF subfamily
VDLHEAARQTPEPELSESPPDGEQILNCRQSAEVLHHAIKCLPPEQELVLRRAFCEARSHREIATERALLLGTVKSRVRLALAALRASLSLAGWR